MTFINSRFLYIHKSALNYHVKLLWVAYIIKRGEEANHIYIATSDPNLVGRIKKLSDTRILYEENPLHENSIFWIRSKHELIKPIYVTIENSIQRNLNFLNSREKVFRTIYKNYWKLNSSIRQNKVSFWKVAVTYYYKRLLHGIKNAHTDFFIPLSGILFFDLFFTFRKYRRLNETKSKIRETDRTIQNHKEETLYNPGTLSIKNLREKKKLLTEELHQREESLLTSTRAMTTIIVATIALLANYFYFEMKQERLKAKIQNLENELQRTRQKLPGVENSG